MREIEESFEQSTHGDDEEIQGADDRLDPFKYVRFTSFRKHKLIEEDYKLLTVDDPEAVTDIIASNIYSNSKVTKEAIEVVPMSAHDLGL